MSEGLDLSAPDRVDEWVYNRILWLVLKGDAPLSSRTQLRTPPSARSDPVMKDVEYIAD
jgi:hypothetical protein